MVAAGSFVSYVGWAAVQYSENVNAAKNVTMNLMVVSVYEFGRRPVNYVNVLYLAKIVEKRQIRK